MGRAPNPGAPQRVSAHVVPKALSPFADEDEKTTIENGWEDEASTTIEQGEVAEKIRNLGLRPITSVTGVSSSGIDEPTVDDQRANAALSMITPPVMQARLLITQGNDSGQEIDIIPGKSYTIGRATDNDVVLTDIAVSRKHFDLRHENGAWVLVDRGSGNGTVINGNVEDNPFMLANGDAIEIGNTTFRFDNPNSMPRGSFGGLGSNSGISAGFNDNSSRNGFDGDSRHGGTFDVDMEEEPSTVAGKPLRADHGETPQPLNSSLPPIAPRPMTRQKTAPPPAPISRPKPMSSQQPPMSYPVMGAALQPPPQMLGSHPQMMHSQPPQQMLAVPHLPQILAQQVPGVGPTHPTMMPGEHMALANVMPTTIPGQGPPMHPSQPQMHALPFTYPNVNDHAQHASAQHANALQQQHASAQHAKMLVITNGMPRDATSTAHVPPTPYNGLPVMQPYVAPTLSRRTKLLLGGAGLTVLAAIATIGLIKGVSGEDAPPPSFDEHVITAQELGTLLDALAIKREIDRIGHQ